MENDPRLEELRNIFLSAPESTTTPPIALPCPERNLVVE